MNMKKGLCGFTLAELLMAVLVISIIMVALAPVITRRAYDNVSIEVNKKKGLEIFTNPGTYTFDVPVGINTLFLQGAAGGGGGGGANYIDKSATFDSSTTWIVPEGVNEIKFTIIGAGGGGGGGYGKTMSDSCESGSRRIPYAADNGQDLCVTNEPPIVSNNRIRVVNIGEDCSIDFCCWKGLPVSAKHTTVCTKAANAHYCTLGKNNNPSFPFVNIDYSKPLDGQKYGRLISGKEITRLIEDTTFRPYLGSSGIDLCYSGGGGYGEANPFPSITPQCTWQNNCPGASANNCMPDAFFTLEGGLYYYGGNTSAQSSVDARAAWAVLCVRNLQNWESFSGAGGASGAMIENKTIKVLPRDTLKITIGNGGTGGSAGTTGSNGNYSAIEHLRNGSRYKDPSNTINAGYYYAYGGTGGLKATSAINGQPQNTVNNGCSHPTECKNIVSSNEGKGYAGVSNAGGNGAGGAKGGTVDTGEGSIGTGYKGANPGYGGGGGACPRLTHNPSGCKKGGNGANGQIIVSYRIAIPGAGGGAASHAGGVSASNLPYEIKYKVKEGERLVFKIGNGGAGGAASQDGINGEATVIGNNDIVFLAGQGGETLSRAQKTNLSNCIGNSTSSTTVSNCIASYKPSGGAASAINHVGNTNTTTTANGLVIKNVANVRDTVPSSLYGGRAGTSGAYKGSTIPWIYGFDGGTGGVTHGMLNTTNFIAANTCGGGIQGNVTLGENNYLCTSGSRNGNDARSHDPVNNRFGGGGGGGGGLVDLSSTLGLGGSGSSGYLRIRWDESENEQW